jgi:hypothetical protein
MANFVFGTVPLPAGLQGSGLAQALAANLLLIVGRDARVAVFHAALLDKIVIHASL